MPADFCYFDMIYVKQGLGEMDFYVKNINTGKDAMEIIQCNH